MHDVAKSLICIGVLSLMIGCVLLIIGKVPGLGKLPGDIFIKKGNLTFYFPIMTSILLSILLSFLFFLWNQK